MLRSALVASVATLVITTAGCAAQTGPTGGPEASPTELNTTSIEPYTPRFDRPRPVVAVLAHSTGAEVTDFVIPYGVLESSGDAEVIAVSTGEGPIEMFPALTIQPDATTADFDRRYPEGADYVIVPAMHQASDPEMLSWIREQAGRGATLVGVCDGVIILANAGVLEGRSATAHWFSIDRLRRKHPGTRWVSDQRYVADGNIVTTTGVSASIPVSLALVEAISGRERAEELASSLGIQDWSAQHDSSSYGLRGHIGTALTNWLAFWRNEEIGLAVAPGVDEISLALQADLWSRTYRSRARTVASAEGPIVTRSGLRLLPDRTANDPGEATRIVEPLEPSEAGAAIDLTLRDIADAYGRSTAEFVAVQIEYDWGG